MTLPLTQEQADALVVDLFKRILERDVDAGGVYAGQLARDERDPIDVVWSIASSEEYRLRFLKEPWTDRPPEDAIRALHAKLFRRAPTDEEVNANVAYYRRNGWSKTVEKVLVDDPGKTYAGYIHPTLQRDLCRLLDERRRNIWLDQVRRKSGGEAGDGMK